MNICISPVSFLVRGVDAEDDLAVVGRERVLDAVQEGVVLGLPGDRGLRNTLYLGQVKDDGVTRLDPEALRRGVHERGHVCKCRANDYNIWVCI